MKKKIFMLLVLICCLPLCTQANTVSVNIKVIMPNVLEANLIPQDLLSTRNSSDTTTITEEIVRNGMPVILETTLNK